MYRTCIAVVDATRARLFILDRTSDAEGLREELSEQRDLVNPVRRLRPSELFSDTRPGLGRSGELQYGFDDHRDAHMDALDVEFSVEITTELRELLRSTAAKRLIVCAGPRMLGHLREARRELSLEIPIDELSRDFVKLTPTAIHEHLVAHGLLQQPPPRAAHAMR
jgi:protein required for attachment to host cells